MKKIFNRHASPEGVKEIIERLEEKVQQYQLKEKEYKAERNKLEHGIGSYLNQEYVYSIIDYIAMNKLETLSLVVTVEHTKEVDECFVGTWYGIKVMDKENEIIKIPTLLDGDGCFVSEVASKRRRKNLLLATKLAEYLKVALESERMIENSFKEAEIKEDIQVGQALFHPHLLKDVLK